MKVSSDDAQRVAKGLRAFAQSRFSVGLYHALNGEKTMIENELDKEFLLKLATLCEEYGAGFTYTTDDDGIHISVDNGREVFVGYMFDPVKELREACGV